MCVHFLIRIWKIITFLIVWTSNWFQYAATRTNYQQSYFDLFFTYKKKKIFPNPPLHSSGSISPKENQQLRGHASICTSSSIAEETSWFTVPGHSINYPPTGSSEVDD